MTMPHRPIRIAYIVHTFDVGGLERCVARLANHLDRDRFRPMIVCLARSGSAVGWIERDDVAVFELHKRPGNDLKAVGRLAEVLRTERVDVVHSHNWGTLVETTLARRRAGVAVHVHTEHGQGLHEGLKGLKRWVRARGRRWAFERLNQLVICAESVRPLIHEQCGFSEERMLFLPNGVDDPSERATEMSPAETRTRLGIKPDAFVVGSVGRLVPVKDFGTAIDSIAVVAGAGIDAHLVLVGDGPEERNLRDQARRLEVSDRVHLVGREHNVGNWLRLFDVYVNCSRSEAMSMGILEAMAAGLPIVATDAGDTASLVDGDNPCGMIVPVSDSMRLADAIQEMLVHEDRGRAYGYAARARHLERYSIERMAENHAQLYFRLLPIPCTWPIMDN